MSNDNSCTLIGNVTRDPEFRATPGGLSVVRFGLAVNKSKKQPDGSYEDVAGFYDVTCFGSLADNVANSISKGNRVTVVGELEFNTWDDKDSGEKRSKVAIVANDVAVSLRWAEVTIAKNAKGSGASSTVAGDDWDS